MLLRRAASSSTITQWRRRQTCRASRRSCSRGTATFCSRRVRRIPRKRNWRTHSTKWWVTWWLFTSASESKPDQCFIGILLVHEERMRRCMIVPTIPVGANAIHTYLQIITGDVQPKTNLTLNDPGIPEHTLLTLLVPQSKAFCKIAMSPVDRYVASF